MIDTSRTDGGFIATPGGGHITHERWLHPDRVHVITGKNPDGSLTMRPLRDGETIAQGQSVFVRDE